MTEQLERVRAAATNATTAQTELIAAMRDANLAGCSLRMIAEAAGVTHETVRTLIRKGTA